MQEFTYELRDPRGIHARPAGLFAALLAKFECDISAGSSEDNLVNAKHVLSLMQLPLRQGDTLFMQFAGSDEIAASAEAMRFLRNYL